MKLSEDYQVEIQEYLNSALYPMYEDTSFAHEFGTQVQGYWYAEIPESCPYSIEEIEYMCKSSDYYYSSEYSGSLTYDAEYEMFLES